MGMENKPPGFPLHPPPWLRNGTFHHLGVLHGKGDFHWAGSPESWVFFPTPPPQDYSDHL